MAIRTGTVDISTQNAYQVAADIDLSTAFPYPLDVDPITVLVRNLSGAIQVYISFDGTGTNELTIGITGDAFESRVIPKPSLGKKIWVRRDAAGGAATVKLYWEAQG